MTGNRMSDKLAGMPARQKVMAVITVIILAGVIWMIIGMFRTPKIEPIASPQITKSASTQGTTMHQGQAMGQAAVGGQQGQQTQPMPQPQLMQTNILTMGKDTDLMKQQQQTQKEYLDRLNELQLLKVQREISETNQAIAAARLATVTADKNMTDLLTKPAAQEIPPGAYASGLAIPVKPGMPIVGPTPAPAEQPAVPAVTAPTYVVISVSMQLNKWHAIIGAGGKLYNVSIGDILPPDGSVVFSISNRGVVLEKGGKKQIINIVSSI